MKIYKDDSLRNFDFWSGAIYTAEKLTCDELDTIENILEDIYPEGMDETSINDLFWFEDDTIAEWLGYDNWEALEASREEE